MIQIALNATYIPSSSKIWCVHGGKSRRVLERFLENGIIILDMPGLNLNENLLRADEDLYKSIMMSEAITSYYRSLKDLPSGRPFPSRPSLNFADYSMPSKQKDIYRAAYKRKAIHDFHMEIQKGDVILTPSFSTYDPFLFGIVEDDPYRFSSAFIPEYSSDKVPSLKVNWISHSITKRDLRKDLARLMERQQVVTGISSEKFGPSLFTAVLGSFYDDALFGVDILCPAYRGRNPLETISVQKLIAATTAIYNAYNEIGLEENYHKIDFDSLINTYYDEELVHSLESEFHSPGVYRSISKASAISMLILLAFALNSSSGNGLHDIDKVKLVGATAQQEDLLETLIKPMVKNMNTNTISKIDEVTKNSKSEIGANTTATVLK